MSFLQLCKTSLARSNDASLIYATQSLGAVMIAAFSVNAAASGTMFVRWWRLSESSRKEIWKPYGWFTGLMCCGSCFGALHGAFWTQFLIYYFEAGKLAQNELVDDDAQEHRMQANAYRWLSAYLYMYPMTFCCLAVSKLLALDRMRIFANFQDERWQNAGRLLVIIVIASNVIGFIGNIVSASYLIESSNFYIKAASSADSSSSTAFSYKQDAKVSRQKGTTAAAVHLFCELLVLLLIILGFLVAGVASSRKIIASMASVRGLTTRDSTIAESQKVIRLIEVGVQLRRQTIITTATIFLSFLLRVIYNVMFAVANSLNNSSIVCDQFIDRCSSCYNNYTYLQVWMLYTPEFHYIIVFVAQNAALLVALWGMTSGRALEIMRNNRKGAAQEGDKDSVFSVPNPQGL